MSKVTPALAVIALAVLAAVFNPSADSHRQRIKESVRERSPVAGALGVGALSAFVSTYHPLGVASYTTVNDRVATVGAFGVVLATGAVTAP